MEEEKFIMSIRRFLKEVGVSSQQQLEKLVHEGAVDGDKTILKVKMVLTADATALVHIVEGEIDLSDARTSG